MKMYVEKLLKKQCVKCEEFKSLEEFYIQWGRSEYRVTSSNVCKECSNRYSKEHHKKRGKNQRLQKTFGITLKEYQQMLEQQNGVCAICDNPPGNKSLGVDHNHITGKIRSLLCVQCNTALGLVKEDIKILHKMICYLQESDLDFIEPDCLSD